MKCTKNVFQYLGALPILLILILVLSNVSNKFDIELPLYIGYVTANAYLIASIGVYTFREKVLSIDTMYFVLLPHVWYIINMITSFILIRPSLLWCLVASAPTASIMVMTSFIILPKYLGEDPLNPSVPFIPHFDTSND